MSAVDLHDLELIWPSLGPTDVIATGTFDKWSSSIHLAKGDGGFFGTVKVPWGQKITYKYVVDGRWQCRDDKPQENDGNGNINNVLLAPERPTLPTLSIPPEGVHGDVETMVTAVEFLDPAEPIAHGRGLLPPLPIPHITVDFSQTPMVGEAKLDTAGATEGNVSPASAIPAGFAQEYPSSDIPVLLVDDSGASYSLPPVDGDGVASEPYGVLTDAPLQFTNGEAPTTSPRVAETGQEAVVAPPEYSPQAAQDIPALADRVDTLLFAGVESPAKQPEAAAPQQDTALASVDQASTPSTPSTQKKRRSLLARIKHIFDKNKDKEKKEKKEKNKH